MKSSLFWIFLSIISTIAIGQPTIQIDPSLNFGEGTGYEFNLGFGTNNLVNKSARQPDGKIIIAGDFEYVNGVARNCIARLNADGTLDETFNPGLGIVSTSGGERIISIALQPDGKIIIGGRFNSYSGTNRNRIARLNPDGSLDETFNPGSGANFNVEAVHLQSDGKILVGGGFTSFNGNTSKRYLVRLNSDGSVDADFNTGTGPDFYVLCFAITPTGKIYVGGDFQNFNGISRGRLTLLNADGTQDLGYFGAAGFSGGSTTNTTIRALALQPDGKLLVGGDFTAYNGFTHNRIARLNADGTIDNSFVTGNGVNLIVRDILLLPDGKFLIGGNFTSVGTMSINYLARINANGSIDNTFQTGTGPSNVVFGIEREPDGRLLVSGLFRTYEGQTRNGFMRVSSEGLLDRQFLQGLGPNGPILGVTPISGNRALVFGGHNTWNGNTTSSLVAINSDGTINSSFTAGTVGTGVIRKIIQQPDGKFLVAGTFTTIQGITRNRIARLNANGTIDATFNPGTGPNAGISDMVLLADGKIVIAGSFTTVNSTSRRYLARLNSNGTLDNTFSPGNSADSEIYCIQLLPDGKFLVGGFFTTFNLQARRYLARINATGSYDATFNPGTGPNNQVTTIVPTPDGKYLIGGGFTSFSGSSRNKIARLNADFSLDASFTPLSGFGSTGGVISIALDTNGKYLVGGNFNSYRGNTRNCLVRLNTDGSEDASFNIGSGFEAGMTINTVNTVVVDSLGRVWTGGDFQGFNGKTTNHLARLRGAECEEPSTPTISGNNTFCAGESTVLTSSATSGNLWSNGATTQSITVSSAGNYSVSVISGSCTSAVSSAVAVTETPLPTTPTISGNNSYCAGENTVLTSSASTGNLWSNGATTQSITVSNAGNYSVRVISGGCTSAVSSVVAVTETPIPTTPTISGNSAFCAGESTVLTSSATTGNLWSNGATTQSITVNSAGNYSVRVISGGCTSAVSSVITVTETPIPSTPTISGNGSFCAGESTVLTSSATTGNLWSNGATTQSITVSNAGNYSVRVISGTCTSAVSTVFAVTEIPLPTTPIISGNNTFCQGESTVLTSSATNGNLWSNGATTQSITVSNAGNYSVRVISGTCTSAVSSVVSVTETPLPTTPNITGNNTFCAGENTVLTSSASTGNLWSSGATTQSITVSSAGNYSVRVISGSCTSAVSSVVAVTETTLPTTPTISGNNIFCQGENTVLTSSATTGNLWSNGATTQSITVNSAGNYSVRVISGGCTSAVSSAVAVTETPLPTTPTISGNNSYCAGENTVLTSSATTGNLWSNGATTQSITVSNAGNYSVRVISGTCTSALSSTVAVTETPLPSTPTISGNNTFCQGENTVLTSSASTGNLWSSGATTQIITVSSAGNYSVRVISGTCTSAVSSVVSVTEIPLPTTPTISGNTSFCQGESTVLTSSATTGNLWSNGATTQSITVSSAGNYSVRVISGSCTSAVSSVVAVTETPLPTTPTISGNNSFCQGESTVLTSSSTTGNLWSNGATTQSITVNSAGNYSVRVISGTCTSAVSSVVAVTETPLPTTPTISGSNTFCQGESTVLTSSATTGNLWSNGATTQSITVNSEGNYSVRVISGTCTSAVSSVIAVTETPLPITPTISGNNTFCAGESTVLTSSATSGNLWSNGATTQSITVSSAGNYSIRVISGSCTSAASNTVAVTQTPLPNTPTISGNNSFCAGESTVLTSSATSGNLWSNGATTQSITVNSAGNYSVRVISGTCTSAVSSVIAVTETPLPTTPSISGNNNYCQGESTVLTSSATTGNLWSNGATTQSITVNSAGNYSVRVISGTCTSAVSSVIAVTETPLPITPTISGNNTFCAGESTVLTSSATSGNLWSNGATTQSITVNSAGNYSVRVISGTCTSAVSSVIAVTETPIPTTPTISGNSAFCAGESTVLTSSSTTGNLWSNGATTQSITVNSAGNYSVRVISGGCTSLVSGAIAVMEISLSRPQVAVSTTNIVSGDSAILTVVNPNSGSEYLWSNGIINTRLVVRSNDTLTVQERFSGCLSEASLPIIITNGKAGLTSKSVVLLYPNPASNLVYVTTTEPIALRFYSTEGKLAKQASLETSGSVDLTGLAAGLYQVVVNSANGQSAMKLVVK